MGTARQKRRKKLNKEWIELQAQHGLSDEDLKLARQTGYPPKRIQNLLVEATEEEGTQSQIIHRLHIELRERAEARKIAIEIGLIEPKQKKPVKKVKHDPMWAKAKEVCRLNMEDIRKAKALGMGPRSLMKNVPAPSQKWKAPVKDWIRELYEKRFPANRKPSDDQQSAEPANPIGDAD